MAVTVHVAAHPNELVSTLCAPLIANPADPFTAEVIAVPTRGIERWLTQRIALELAAAGVGGGISANIEFPSPAELVKRAIADVPALAHSLEMWEGSPLMVAVIDAIDTHLDESWMALLHRHLGAAGTSRMAAASKVAWMFTRYARRRPAMIASWGAGHDTGQGGEALADHHRWQPRLWRAVRERIGVPTIPELGSDALEPIRRGTTSLPQRISVYGLTAADPFDLAVMIALGETHDVDLHVLHPSPALWLEQGAKSSEPGRRSDDATRALAHHPLLGAWGRDSRELQSVLAAHGLSFSAGNSADADADAAPTILARLQGDIRANRFTTGRAFPSGDRSIQVHVCHGARRQVEVMRDALLHILVADPSLEPRDIVIMTPDLATFAPLIEAAFPQDDLGGLPDLRVRIADRSPSAVNPLVRFAVGLLTLIEGRLEAAVVRELVTRPVVQRRFAFDAETGASVTRIIDDVGVAWGLDAADRQSWGVNDVADRTWARGLDRALTGVFYSDSRVRVVGGVAPLDGVEGQDARPVGILAAILDRIAAIRSQFGTPRPMAEWAVQIAAVCRMLADPGWEDEWQWAQLEQLLDETFPTGGSFEPMVTLSEALLAISVWEEERPSPLHFRTGDITVSTLAPMRSVPYRVVCLLGMDDDRFPRSGRGDGDDLVGAEEFVGDRDRSGEDRQLLLDAVIAAGDHLVITYSGRDEITNADYPPAVPIAELIDVLGVMSGRARSDIETRHPLQSFSESVFTAGALGIPSPWGFDPMQLAGAEAVQARTQSRTAAPISWPPLDPPDVIKLNDLTSFLANPAAGFVRASLGFRIPRVEEVPDDSLPVDLGPLEKWALRDRLILGLAAGYELDDLLNRELAADSLPPESLAEPVLDLARADVTDLWQAALKRGYHPTQHLRYTGELVVNGRLVEGSVVANPQQSHLALITPSRVKARHRLASFVDLAFLTALHPEQPWLSLVLARPARGGGLLEVTLGPLGETAQQRQERALELLAVLVDIHDEGHRSPLPLPCETGFAWQRAAKSRSSAMKAAGGVFERERFSPERDDVSLHLLFPEVRTLDDLVALGFADQCARLWGPINALMKDASI